MKKKIVAILTGMTLVMSNGIFVSASESQAGVESQAALENETFTSEQQDFDEESSEADVQSDEFSDEEAGEVFSDNVQDNNQSSKNDISIPGADLNEDDLTQNASASGTIVLGVKGSYIADIQAALDRINEIRKEACNEGVQDPRNPSRRLTSSDYVPIKWSSDLEYIARIRAAEASVYIEHTRPNGSSCWTVKSPDGEQSWGEVLAWNWSNSMVPGINQWYDEKEDWVKQNTSAVTGHYTQMIDPSHTYIGLSTFYNEDGAYLNTTCGEFSYGSGMDETRGSAEDNCTQEIEFAQSQVSVSMNLSKEALNVNETAKAELAIEGYRCKVYYVEGKTDPITWSSSDPAVASVDADGTVTGISDGTATITGKLGNSKIAQKTVTVTDKKDINDEDVEEFIGAGADIVLFPAPGTVPGITMEYVRSLVKEAHSRGVLTMTSIGTSQEGADTETIRQIALMCKMAGTDIHHLGDSGYTGMALPENIMAYGTTIRGIRHQYHRMAQSIRR